MSRSWAIRGQRGSSGRSQALAKIEVAGGARAGDEPARSATGIGVAETSTGLRRCPPGRAPRPADREQERCLLRALDPVYVAFLGAVGHVPATNRLANTVERFSGSAVLPKHLLHLTWPSPPIYDSLYEQPNPVPHKTAR